MRKIIRGIFFLGAFFLLLPLYTVPSTGQTLSIARTEALTATPPALNFSTFLGGNAAEDGNSIAIASDGSCYVTGYTKSSNFPTLNAFNSTYGGGSYSGDAFVSKFSASGSLLWSTYLGGKGDDCGYGIAVASDGSCYVTGETSSSNFPTQNAYDSSFNGGFRDVFVTKFSTNGELLWSTYLGGVSADFGHGIALGSNDTCYLTGYTGSSDFPVLGEYDNTLDGVFDVFVAKFNSSGFLKKSTFFGGGGSDSALGIAVDAQDSCYITGNTDSSDLPTQYAYDTTLNGAYDAFVTKFNLGFYLLFSTYFGGSDSDSGYDITVTSDGNCYVTGYTASADFPIKNAFNDTFGGSSDAFVAKFAWGGSLQWSTYLGGNDFDYGYGIAITDDGSCYVTGFTDSNNFPIKNAYNSTYGGYDDIFLVKFSSIGSLLWSTFLGGSEYESGLGIAVMSEGSCYVTGQTSSKNFPTLNAYNSTYSGSRDVFVIKFQDDLIGPIIQTVQNEPSNPTDLETVTISCSVSDEESGVAFVTLYYRINSGGTWIITNMTYITGTTYEKTIGPFEYASVVEYYILAVDNSPDYNPTTEDNSGAYYTFSVTSGDFTEPVIINVAYTPEFPTINDDNITFSCTVTDESGIQSVTLHFKCSNVDWDWVGMFPGTANKYQIILDISPIDFDWIEFYIEAVDDSPNHNTAVEDNDGDNYLIFISTPSQSTSVNSCLVLMVVLPIIVMLSRRRVKQ